MATTFTKADENTLNVKIETSPAVESAFALERGWLERHRKAIAAQRDAYVAARNRELEEVDGYLAECDRLGIVAKPMSKLPGEE